MGMTQQERLARIDERMKTLQAQKRQIIARENAQARKERNHRLIQIGANVETLVGCEIKDMDAFCEYLKQYSGAIRSTQIKPKTVTVKQNDK